MLAKRSNEPVPYIPSQQPLLKTYRYEFNEESAKNKMLLHANDLHDVCIENHHNPDKIWQEIEACVIPIITVEKIKVYRSNNPNYDEVVNNCDTLFKEDVKCLNGKNATQEIIMLRYNKYQEARSFWNASVLKRHESEYAEIINAKDDRKLWNKIDWGGNIKTVNSKNHPDITDLADHFETLYEPLPHEDTEELNNLSSDVYIPINDDPINDRELSLAASPMKKGGWDYFLSVLKLLMCNIPGCILSLINAMFYFNYPIKLAISPFCMPFQSQVIWCHQVTTVEYKYNHYWLFYMTAFWQIDLLHGPILIMNSLPFRKEKEHLIISSHYACWGLLVALVKRCKKHYISASLTFPRHSTKFPEYSLSKH